jgi:hypothetical protein
VHLEGKGVWLIKTEERDEWRGPRIPSILVQIYKLVTLKPFFRRLAVRILEYHLNCLVCIQEGNI